MPTYYKKADATMLVVVSSKWVSVLDHTNPTYHPPFPGPWWVQEEAHKAHVDLNGLIEITREELAELHPRTSSWKWEHLHDEVQDAEPGATWAANQWLYYP
jgi:hypothetical protein